MTDTARDELEQYVLGALLWHPAHILQAVSLDPPIVWQTAVHEAIFVALVWLATTPGQAVTVPQVARLLARSQALQPVGGAAYLRTLRDTVPQPLPMSALDAAAMLCDQQRVRRAPPARDRVPHLIQQALEAWRYGTAVSVRQGLFTTMHHAGCLDEWNYLCRVLTDWGLYGLGALAAHVRRAHMPAECRVEAWRVATEARWRQMEAVVPLRTLQNLLLTVSALAFLGQLPPAQADDDQEPDPQAP